MGQERAGMKVNSSYTALAVLIAARLHLLTSSNKHVKRDTSSGVSRLTLRGMVLCAWTFAPPSCLGTAGSRLQLSALHLHLSHPSLCWTDTCSLRIVPAAEEYMSTYSGLITFMLR